jgi:hypothetical protein
MWSEGYMGIQPRPFAHPPIGSSGSVLCGLGNVIIGDKMKQYGKGYKILFGIISFSSFIYFRVQLGYYPRPPLLSDICFFIFRPFIYFIIFSLIESGVGRVTSFHQEHNQQNIHRQPLKYFIKNKILIIGGYKFIFNLEYLLIAFLVLKHYISK